MAKNQISEGRFVDVIAPYAVDSGDGCLVGSMFGVAMTDALISTAVVLDTEGVYRLKKVTAEVWAIGSPLYWVTGTGLVSSSAGGGSNQQIGIAMGITTSSDTTGAVRLNGPPGVLSAISEAAALADLTEAAGAIGGSSDGNLPDLTATAATLTGSLTGSTNGALVDVAATAGSCAGTDSPSATNVDTAIATAVATIVTGINTQNKEMLEAINKVIADNVALRAAIRELAVHHNTALARLRTTNVIADA